MRYGEGTFQGTRGTELCYQAWRPTGKPRAVVVGVHGHGDHSGGLRNIVQHLLPMRYAWYGFDLRGHGRSPGIRGHVRSWAEFHGDLKAFLYLVKDREPGLPVFLLGHSLGGLISLEYAIRWPKGLKGLIAISPAIHHAGIPSAMVTPHRAISSGKPDLAKKELSEYAKLTRDAEIKKSLAADPLRHEQMTAGLWRAVLDGQDWVKAHACDLRLPLLLLYGLNDQVTPGEGSRRFFHAVPFANKERYEYEHTVHRPFDDVNRAEVLGHLSAWLDRQMDGAVPAYMKETI